MHPIREEKNSVTDASQHTKNSSTRFRVPGIASNIPRSKSALVMGIVQPSLAFNSSPAKTVYNRNKLKIYLKRNSSKLNLNLQSVHVVATGEHSVFCCFD